jgi:hypothetical protein
MDGSTLDSRLRDDYETELSRLGSSKWLYALTGGDLDGDAIRAVADADAGHAAETFGAWDDGPAGDLFAAVAESAADHRDRIDADATSDVDRPLYDAVDGDDAPTRLGALFGWSTVAGKTLSQMVGFFVGDANPAAADAFRGIRDDVDDHREDALGALEEHCGVDDDWERAEAAAAAVVEAAYDEYVEKLEAMGIKPKNIC